MTNTPSKSIHSDAAVARFDVRDASGALVAGSLSRQKTRTICSALEGRGSCCVCRRRCSWQTQSNGHRNAAREEASVDAGCNFARLLLKRALKDIGIAGMTRTALWLDTRLDAEVLSLGRGALAREDCELRIALSKMFVRVTIQGSWIWVYACGLDQGPPESLFNVGDGPRRGGRPFGRFVAALERSGIQIVAAASGSTRRARIADCFVIG